MCRTALTIIGLFLMTVSGLVRADTTSPGDAKSRQEDFGQSLKKLAAYSPDVCAPPNGRESDWHTADTETRLYEQAARIVAAALGAASPDSASARERATETLKQLEMVSAQINSAWPEESRFHFEVLEVPPALLIEMTIRSSATFAVFGVPEKHSEKLYGLWREFDSSESFSHGDIPAVSLDLRAIHRSPSGNARFLARFNLSGCAGSTGIEYDAYEWNPQDLVSLETIIKQEGAFGLDDKVPGFPQIGEVKVEGTRITLPYCSFSPIDTWDNPSLCAVDTYDLSGDDVKFQSRIYNRPELVPVAKAVEYAERRDYAALLGYCATPQVAQSLIRDLPPHVFAEDLRVTRTGTGKERVEMGPEYRFDVQKRGERWFVIRFSAK